MEILKIVIPKWNIAEITGYDPMTTFWQKIVEAHGGVIELVKFPKEGLSTEFRIWMYTDEE